MLLLGDQAGIRLGSGGDQLLCAITKLPASFGLPAPRFDFLCPLGSNADYSSNYALNVGV